MTCEDCKVIQSKCPEGMDYEMRCLHVENLLEEKVKRRIKANNDKKNLQNKICTLNKELMASFELTNKRKRGRPRVSESNKRAKLEEEQMDVEEEIILLEDHTLEKQTQGRAKESKKKEKEIKIKVNNKRETEKVKRKVGRPKGSKNKPK